MPTGNKFTRFILSKVFLKQLAYAVVVTIVLIFIAFFSLNLFTQHGRGMAVPSFYGLFPAQAEELAKDNKLKVEVIDSIFDSTVERGTVVEQNPASGKLVKKGRRILLVINANNREIVEVPDVVGVTHRQAKASLEMAGLEVGKLSYVPDIAENNVLKQTYGSEKIQPGDSLPKGTKIDLVLGTGLGKKRTHVPDLAGMSLDKAKDKLHHASLNTGAILFDNSVLTAEDSAAAIIYKQNPVFSEKGMLRLGTPVYLWLTVDSLKIMEIQDTVDD